MYAQLIDKIKKHKISISLCLSIIFLIILKIVVSKYFHIEGLQKAISLFLFAAFFIIFIRAFILCVKKKYILVGNIILLTIFYTTLELICFFLLGMPYVPIKRFKGNKNNTEFNKIVGWGAPADTIIGDIKMNGLDTVFNAHYSIDKNHNRITPQGLSKKNKYALFFGCSMTYGWGISDSSTLPYFFQAKTDSFRSYNYSYPGWGTQQMLSRLEHENIRSEVKENDGIAIYVFAWSHVPRVIGDMTSYTEWAWTWPYYKLEEDSLICKGNFADDRKLISGIYELLYNSYILKYFKVNFPNTLTDEHLKLTAKIIEKSKEEYSKQFHNDNFYILFYPNSWTDYQKKYTGKFTQLLEKSGLKYLNLSDSLPADGIYVIPNDGHPNALSNERVSRMLINALNINK